VWCKWHAEDHMLHVYRAKSMRGFDGTAVVQRIQSHLNSFLNLHLYCIHMYMYPVLQTVNSIENFEASAMDLMWMLVQSNLGQVWAYTQVNQSCMKCQNCVYCTELVSSPVKCRECGFCTVAVLYTRTCTCVCSLANRLGLAQKAAFHQEGMWSDLWTLKLA
jgi:hypothetical protein